MSKAGTPWTVADLSRLGVAEILNALADGAYVTDTERRILFWNDSAERITGWTAAEVLGHACRDNILVHVDKDGHKLCGEEFCPLHRSIVTGQRSVEPLLIFAQKRTGERVPVEVTVAPIRNGHGQVVAGIELFRDLTSHVEDLQRAQVIQATVLQCPLPKDDRLSFEIRYTPSEIVGGDFYRIEQIDADLYTMIIADVMGHGVASALYTMQLRSLWEDWREELNYPAAFLGRINNCLHVLTREAGYFATAACVNYNAATGELHYVLAGHPSPLLLRHDNRIDVLPEQQPALGMFPNFRYTEGIQQIAPDEAMLLLTDGALEVNNEAGEELGTKGLIQLLTKAAGNALTSTLKLPQIEEQILRFGNQIRLQDDMTLMKITRRTPER